MTDPFISYFLLAFLDATDFIDKTDRAFRENSKNVPARLLIEMRCASVRKRLNICGTDKSFKNTSSQNNKCQNIEHKNIKCSTYQQYS